jgi:hypothetical protein
MTQFVYSPLKINGFVSTFYLVPNGQVMTPRSRKFYCNQDGASYETNSKDEIAIHTSLDFAYCENKIPFVRNANRSLLYFTEYDFVNKKWIYYHCNPNHSDDKIILDEYKKKESNKYFCILRDELIPFLTIESDTISFNSRVCEFYDPCESMSVFSDIFVFDNNGAIVHINPSSYFDLIFATIRTNNNFANTKNMFQVFFSEENELFLENAKTNFNADFGKVSKIKPMPDYVSIHGLFMNHDKEYYDNKMQTFNDEVMQFLNEFNEAYKTPTGIVDFVTKFIYGVKKDIMLEICTVYHRFINFPKERILLFKRYPNHPFVKLLKIVHKQYEDGGKIYLDAEHVGNLFQSKENDYVIYNEITHLLSESIKTRSQLFVPVYSLYLESQKKHIKPKYKTKYNYFPFKVFSAKLFILEHLMNM